MFQIIITITRNIFFNIWLQLNIESLLLLLFWSLLKHWLFFIHQEKNEKKLGIIFKGFWCGIMSLQNKKFVHDA
jgi:hypothetical protein